MQKITRLFLAVFATAFFIAALPACKKDNGGDEAPPCNIANAEGLTYSAHIKPIIDEHCITCHNGSGVGPGDYTTYQGIKPDLDEGEVLRTVVIEKTMPQSGNITQAERDSINCWITNGYKQ